MKIPTSSAGRAYPKSSSDGFMGRGETRTKAGSTTGEKLGPQLVRDPRFYNPETWVVGTEWTVGFGKAVGVPATNSAITQLEAYYLEAGETYRVEIEMVANAGAVTVEFTSGTDTVSSPQSGDNSFTLVAQTGNNAIAIRKAIDFDGEITYLSVRKVTT